MVKAITFIVKKIDRPSRVNIPRAAPDSPFSCTMAAAIRQPRQQYTALSSRPDDSSVLPHQGRGSEDWQ